MVTIKKTLLVDEVMSAIKEDAELLKKKGIKSDNTMNHKISKLLKVFKKINRYITNKKYITYSFSDFNKFADYTKFINNAYNLILDRDPDKDGLNQNILRLNNKWKKIDVIFLLVLSEESLYRGVKIKYLFFFLLINQIYKIPLLGRLFHSFLLLLRLPSIITSLRLGIEHNNDKSLILNQIFSQFKNEIDFNTDDLALIVDKNSSSIDKFSNIIEPTHGLIKEKMDNFYFEFEEEFRGSTDVIKKRQEPYIPMITKAYKSIRLPVLDVACGRGEMLSLLRDNNITASGVDINKAMLRDAKANGLSVHNEDAFDYLMNLEPDSLSVITSFHFVEHLHFPQLINFISLCHKALHKGGLLILETPNPENIIVGTSAFHMDPTHIKPLPPLLLQFLIKNQKFIKSDIFTPFKREDISSTNKEFQEFYNSWVLKYPDYAIIGKK